MAPLLNERELKLISTLRKRDGDTSEPTLNTCIGPRGCFTNSTDTSIMFCLTTEWHITYPQKLRHGLSEIDQYTTIDYSDPDFDKCGWNKGESYSKASVDRATVYYKSTNGSLEIRPPNLPDRLQGAEQVFRSTYPAIEIFLILFFTLGWIPLCLLCLCCTGCKNRIQRRKRNVKSAQKPSKAQRSTGPANQQAPEAKSKPTKGQSSTSTSPPPYKETDSRKEFA